MEGRKIGRMRVGELRVERKDRLVESRKIGRMRVGELRVER